MAVHHDTDQKLAEHDKAQAHGDKASHESEKQAEKDKQAAAKEAEVDNSPDAIVTRIEGLVAQMHDATPSGTLTIQEQMTKELKALREYRAAAARGRPRQQDRLLARQGRRRR